LEPDDIVLIVLNQSDYYDVLRRRFFGRAKPYFEKVDGSYVLRPASLTSGPAKVVSMVGLPAAVAGSATGRRKYKVLSFTLKTGFASLPKVLTFTLNETEFISCS
jgi:hypothetical protein